MSTMKRRCGSCAIAVAVAISSSAVLAQSGAPSDSIFDLSIEELVSLEVTSVSKKAESLDEAASAVFVISQDDIRRTGVRNIPEALRLAPGLTVLQIDSNKWAIGARGFVGRFSNKLLVMIDGRIVYTPSFSGVFWDVQDTSLEDIERIEVIRGPGATVWGSNAVNGAINIITKRSGLDAGAALTTRLESDGSYLASGRLSGTTEAGLDYRFFIKHHNTRPGEAVSGLQLADEWQMTRIGARLDFETAVGDTVMASAEAYQGHAGMTSMNPEVFAPYLSLSEDRALLGGGHVTAKWTREVQDSHRTDVHVVLEATERHADIFVEDRRTLGMDVQHQRNMGAHTLMTGLEFRHDDFRLGGSTGSNRIRTIDSLDKNRVISAFVQSDIQLIPERLRLTLGSKFENNQLSDKDIELLPSARLSWQINSKTNLWGAVTRAVRTPSLAERIASVSDVSPVTPPGGANNPFPLPLRVSIVSNPNFESEDVLSSELGIRSRIGSNLGWGLSLFNMKYDSLRSPVVSGAFCQPSGIPVALDPSCLMSSHSVMLETLMTNTGKGDIRGGELTVDWAPTSNFRLRGSWSLADESIRDVSDTLVHTFSPEKLGQVLADWRVTSNVTISSVARYVDQIPGQSAESFTQADVHVNWQVSPQLRLSIGGRNLVRKNAPEYCSELNDAMPAAMQRTGLVQARWSF